MQTVKETPPQSHTIMYVYLENGEYRLVINPKTPITEDIECEVIEPNIKLIEEKQSNHD